MGEERETEEEREMEKSLMKVGRPLNVEEEYYKAIRTKSFIDMWAKAHQLLKRTSSPQAAAAAVAEEEDRHTGSSQLSLRYYAHLANLLLEPSQETILAAAADEQCTAHLHPLLLDYFDTTLEACDACASLLACIDRSRSHHRVLLLRLRDTHAPSAFSDLASHAELDNPLSARSLARFHRAHARCGPLIRRLADARRRIAWRVRLLKLARKASGFTGCGLPAERAGAQVDAAAKGAFIVGRELDTVSRMVSRLQGEVEHGREVVQMVLRSRERGLAREVVREAEGGEVGFGEQLAELEEHVYLCLLTINRSRRLVAEEMGGVVAAARMV